MTSSPAEGIRRGRESDAPRFIRRDEEPTKSNGEAGRRCLEGLMGGAVATLDGQGAYLPVGERSRLGRSGRAGMHLGVMGMRKGCPV